MTDTRLESAAFPVVDRALAQRLERAEAMANAATVDSRRERQPEVGADWMNVAGVYAMFDGPASPLTQTFGLGLFESFLADEFERVEAFFTRLGAPTAHEVSSFAASDTVGLLGARGYTPIEASVVLVQPVPAVSAPSEAGAILVRAIDVSESDMWSRVSADAWCSELPDLRPFIESLGTVVAHARDATCFVAEREGTPIAAAALNVCNGVALLAGAATIPSARKQGAQRELLRARLAFAAARGIGLAMVVTQPGSASQRNAERQGFRPVYTRAKWQRQGAHP